MQDNTEAITSYANCLHLKVSSEDINDLLYADFKRIR